MERQALIFILLLILLLASKGMNFAEEPTIPRVPIRDRLASAARHFLGLPYRWGGMSERRGMDCSGLIKTLFAKLNIEVPRTARDQYRAGQEVTVENLQAGDLLFFSTDGMTPDHVGVYVGEHRFVHAEKKAGRVIITDLNQSWYIKHFIGARRIVLS
ncbi:MAG TPA: C40 family peptidase [Phototrophicaceae bacterium]|jgi:cell wall-associated NlpC family hydrolase|nr:C40 family peptidase [Phototrophicaceae bacterium]